MASVPFWVSFGRFSLRKAGLATATVAPALVVVIARSKALHRSSGFDRRAIDAEMIAREQPANARPFKDCSLKTRGDLAGQHSVAVLGKGRVVPHRLVDPEAHKPADHQIKLQILHQLPLRVNRIKGPQQHRAKRDLRRDRGPPHPRIGRRDSLRCAPNASSTQERVGRIG